MNNQALVLIEEAKAKRSAFLDLGNLGLSELPDQLFELTHLEALNVGARYFYEGKWHHSANQGEPNVIKWIPWRIKRLTSLEYLSMFGIYAGDIHGLQGLPQLKHLDLSFNYQIRDFKALQYLRRLQYLSLNTSEIYDLGVITAAKHLTFLDLSYNRRRTLERVAKFSKLSTLLLANTLDNHTDLRPLQQLEHLIHLDLGANTLSDFQTLSLPQLEYFGLFDLDIEDASFLHNFPKLKHLVLWRNKLTDVLPLTALTSLEHLNLRANKLEDISPLLSLPSLKTLDVAQNPIQHSGQREGLQINLH